MPTQTETILKETAIPTYSLQQSSAHGNHLFEMVVSNCDMQQQKKKIDFLVPHRRDYYMFILVRKGSNRHWVDTNFYTIRDNTFYLSSPGQVLVKEKSNPMEGVFISFSEEFINMDESKTLHQLPIIKNPYNAHEFALKPEDLAFIEDLMKKMWTEYTGNHTWRYSMLLSYVRIMAIYMSRLYTEQFTAHAGAGERILLQRFKQLINEHYIERHQVSDYARLLHITAGYLNDVVKEQSGKTAMEHIHERIVLEAQRKLFYTDSSAKEIAYELGFEDAAYFNRFFKRLTEQTPAVFRQSTREMYH